VKVVAHTYDGWIVELGYSHLDNGIEYSDSELQEMGLDTDLLFEGIEKVDELFVAPPVPAYDAEVLKLRTEEQVLINQIRGLREDLRKAVQERDTTYAELGRQEPALLNLRNYIEGKYTHFVIDDHYKGLQISDSGILEYDEDRGYNSRNPRRQRLLTLCGDSKGNLMWELSKYPSVDRNYDTVYPFMSHDDALAHVKKMCEQGFSELRELLQSGEDILHHGKWYNTAERFGIEIPADLVKARHESMVNNARKYVVQSKEQLARGEATLNELEMQSRIDQA
jgi:hypothetical protein